MSTQDQIPRVTLLSQVYETETSSSSSSSPHGDRFTNLIRTFERVYDGHRPDGVARSPGRVNIIGEHVDYSLYNVLPAAVEVDALIAFRSSGTAVGVDETTIEVTNVNAEKYPPKMVVVPGSGAVEIDTKNHEWSNYFKAGLKGAVDYLRQRFGDDYVPKNMQVLVDGNVPAGGGLSSSAAFVCASVLAVMEVNGHQITKQDLLDLCIVSERSVGVFSGGMDQAASIFSEKGYLLYCQFYPEFKAEQVPVPRAEHQEDEVTFLVAQSFVTSDKAVTAPRHYNLRVVECTLATVVLAKLHSITLDPDHSSLGFCLRNFEEEYMRRQGRLEADPTSRLNQLISLVEKSLTQDAYSREDIASILDISLDTLGDTYMSKFPIEADAFKLRQRALHVLQEARRVLQFKDVLASTSTLSQDKLQQLGDLMNATQTSCRDVYECSCPEIDLICEIARQNGALGSRLTGAGWGGCTVHLVPQNKIRAVTEALKQRYYITHLGKSEDEVDDEFMQQAIVISKPGVGSQVIEGEALET